MELCIGWSLVEHRSHFAVGNSPKEPSKPENEGKNGQKGAETKGRTSEWFTAVPANRKYREAGMRAGSARQRHKLASPSS